MPEFRFDVLWTPLARAEVAAIDDPDARAEVFADAATYLPERLVRGGRASKVPSANPTLWEFRVDTKDHWFRLFYFEYGRARYLVSLHVKKKNRLPQSAIDLAQDRATRLLKTLPKPGT
jgi:phage-related protein